MDNFWENEKYKELKEKLLDINPKLADDLLAVCFQAITHGINSLSRDMKKGGKNAQ
jgi:hypothetical protein